LEAAWIIATLRKIWPMIIRKSPMKSKNDGKDWRYPLEWFEK